MKRIAWLVAGWLLGAAPPLMAQSVPAAVTDTTVFSAADFYRVVVLHHPLVRQAALFSLDAQQDVRQARGAFDPKLFSTYDRKEFGKSLYYNKWQSGLSVPIMPGGIDLKMTYDRNTGQYLNEEERVPSTGLVAVGVRVPVGQGLLTDARRTALRQAELAVGLADADRLKLINKTLFDAAKTYWEWYFAHRQYVLLRDGYQVADIRFRAVQQRAALGDAAPVDTTEALITAQDRLVQFGQAEADRENARLRLTAFLWYSDGPNATPQPADLPPSAVPQAAATEPVDAGVLDYLLDRTIDHPDLRKLTTKGRQLAVEERFRRSLLWPQLAVSANLLSRAPLAGADYYGPNDYAFRADNHKIGVDLMFPLFLRKERGKLRQIQLKTQQVDLERQQTTRDIANDVQTVWNTLRALEQQIVVQQQTVANQQRLLGAEGQKFDLGESTLFLVNSRESKRIDLQIKLEELRTKYQKAVAELWYAAGTYTGAPASPAP